MAYRSTVVKVPDGLQLRAELLEEYGPLGVAAWRTRYAREAECCVACQMRELGFSQVLTERPQLDSLVELAHARVRN